MQRFSVTNGAAGSCPGSCTETKTGYYTTGNVALTKVQRDPATTLQTSLVYDDSFLHITEPSPGTLSTTIVTKSPPTFAYPTRVTDPDGFSSTVAYNYDFGGVTRTVDPKEYALHGASPTTMGVTTYDSKGRPEKMLVWKDGAKYSQTRYVYSTDHNWTQTFTTVNNLSEETFVLSLLDGASRERITISDHPGSAGGLRSSYKVFDLVGRVTEWSRPTEINGSWAPSGDDTAYVITTQTYDWKSRPLVTTSPDNTTRQVGYTGCGCAGGDVITTTDEVGKKQELTRDVSGRVITTKLLRPDNSLYATTTRSYNVRDQVLSTKLYQGSGDGVSCPAGTCEETLTEYDGYGRVWKRRLPQYQASTLDPNFTASATPYDLYEYNADDTLWKVTDPRTASVTYSYNNRRQVTGLTYGVPAGVASTPNVTFGYDAAGRRLWMDDGPGRVDYVYDTLNRLITEKRKFDEFSAPHEMSFAYNLVGQLKQITDPAGAVIDYSFDKTGRLKTVTGSPFAGVTQYIGDVSYRAWNAAKQVSYDGTQTATMSYNNRMLVSQFALNGVTANYSYRSDGRVNGLTSSDAKLNRTFGYDDFGRISSSVAGGGSEPEQFNQSYGYDVFNNFTSRSGRYWWVNGNQSYTASWGSGRLVSANENGTTISTEHTPSGQMIRSYYLNQGNQVNKDGPFRYDAAGRVTGEGAVSGSNPEQTMFYDGDGRMVKDLRNSTTTYSMRSSVFGGAPLTLLDASGQKKQTHVYANGQIIATQEVSSYGNSVTVWRRDPHNTLSFGGTGSSPQILDPLNVSVSPATATQIQQYWQNQYQPSNGYGNPYGTGYGPPASISSGTTCKADGGPIPCSMVLGWRNHEWVKEARVIDNLGGVGTGRLGEWRQETHWNETWNPNTNTLTATANTIFIWEGEDIVDFGNLIGRQTQLDQFVREITEIKQAIADAMVLLKNGDCNKYLSSDKHKARNLLKDLDKLNRINRDFVLDDPQNYIDKYGRSYKGILFAEARGVGIGTKEENIGIGKRFFGEPPANEPSGGGAYEKLTARGFRALNILHELGHKTGRYVHEKPDPNYQEVIDTSSLNSGVFFNCFVKIKNKDLMTALVK